MSNTDANKKKAGRPVGSRNKSTLIKAQVLIDDLSYESVQYLEALMKNDTEFLNCKTDVNYTIRFNATKELLSKGIANEKEKNAMNTPPAVQPTDGSEEGHIGPQVFSTAK